MDANERAWNRGSEPRMKIYLQLTERETECANKCLVAYDNRDRRNHRQTQCPDSPELELLAVTHFQVAQCRVLPRSGFCNSTHHRQKKKRTKQGQKLCTYEEIWRC